MSRAAPALRAPLGPGESGYCNANCNKARCHGSSVKLILVAGDKKFANNMAQSAHQMFGFPLKAFWDQSKCLLNIITRLSPVGLHLDSINVLKCQNSLRFEKKNFPVVWLLKLKLAKWLIFVRITFLLFMACQWPYYLGTEAVIVQRINVK